MENFNTWFLSIYAVIALVCMVYGLYSNWDAFLKPNTDTGSRIVVLSLGWLPLLIVLTSGCVGKLVLNVLRRLTYGDNNESN